MPFLTPLMHPAAIERGMWSREPAQELYLERLVETQRAGREPIRWNVREAPCPVYLYPTLRLLDRWHRETLDAGYDALSIDIENAGQFLVMLGLLPFDSATGTVGTGLCQRFYRQHGQRYWTQWSDHRAAVEWTYGVLADPRWTKVFHNGVSHDVPTLERLGFEVAPPILDTLWLAHHGYSEFPRGLQWLSTLHCWAPCWKGVEEDDDED